jgi:hydroxyacyl-ACP dehydratase HTD2-like protein with hotdog domain
VTLNEHRIHYDADYVRGVEGYPGLVGHGPLQAIILMNLFRDYHPDARIKAFQFRGKAPLFAGEDAVFGLAVEDGAANLWVQPANREVSFVASIQFDRPAFTRRTVGR